MGLAGVAFMVWGIRGINPQRYRTIGNAFGFAVTFAMGAVLLHGAWQIEDLQSRGQLTQAAFIVLGIAGVGIIISIIEGHHRQTRLKLLELEYRLADLANKIGQK
jgi:hypothetical protein